MASKVQIVNLALSRLGAQRITSLTDNTQGASLANTLYDDVAAEVISEGPWACAINRATLAQTTNTPEYGFSYEYQLPTDPLCLKVLDINETEAGDYEFKIEGDKLLIDNSAVKIRYIGMVDDTESYSQMLKKAIVSRLAAEMAYTITGDSGVVEAMFNIADRHLYEGLAIDGQQGSSDSFVVNTLTGDR